MIGITILAPLIRNYPQGFQCILLDVALDHTKLTPPSRKDARIDQCTLELSLVLRMLTCILFCWRSTAPFIFLNYCNGIIFNYVLCNMPGNNTKKVLNFKTSFTANQQVQMISTDRFFMYRNAKLVCRLTYHFVNHFLMSQQAPPRIGEFRPQSDMHWALQYECSLRTPFTY